MNEVAAEFQVVNKLVSRGKKLTQLHYDKLHRNVMKIPGIRALSCHHVIGVAAIVGIVPLSLFPFVQGGAKKFYTDLEKHFRQHNQQLNDDEMHITLPEKEVVIENVAYLAKELFGYGYIFIRNGENISCKIGRILTGFDTRFWDIWERHFPAFEIDRR